MGAEPDVPSPPPEPEISGHDNRNWKADMMSALGESVSFGRFLSEPLEWGKWSAFAHNRYLEEAARQSRPGSVAQRKAFFEAHYARKRKSDQQAGAAGAGGHDDEGGLEAAERGRAPSSSSTESSCMTDDTPGPEMSGGVDADATDRGDRDAPQQVVDELEAVAGAVASSCRVDGAADKLCHGDADARVAGDVQVRGQQSQQKQDLCSNPVAVDAAQKQPLQEINIANQDITDSVKKRRLHMSSLLQKPHKFSSPPSGKKGQSSSSLKTRSPLYSAKENTSPPSTGSSKQTATSVPKRRSTVAALHMSMSFTRCETANAASSKRNIGTTIAERISQLESASRPAENTQPEEFRPPTKIFSQALSETAPKTPQVDQQRSSHVMRVKEKLFGSTSLSLHHKTNVTKEKEKKLKNELGCKESRQSFCFKARPLPNFYRKNKQAKDSSQQTVQEIPDLPNSDHLLSDVTHAAHQTSKGVTKEKQMCCFPIRKLY